MSIWADKIMTLPLENGKESNINNNNTIKSIGKHIDTENKNSKIPPATSNTSQQYVLSLDSVDMVSMEQNDILNNTANDTVIKVLHRNAFNNRSSRGPTTGPFSFIKSIGSYFPLRSKIMKNSSASASNIESCEVLENFNAMSVQQQPSTNHILLNRNQKSSTSSSSGNSSLSANSSKQLCSSINKDEVILSTKCDKDINCDKAVELRIDQPSVVADETIATEKSGTGRKSFILPRVNLKTW